MTQPLIVSYGAGRDSTALIIELHRRGLRPDAIVFANIGSEKKETYQFIRVFDRWLIAHSFPAATVVRYQPVHAAYRSLEGNMILNATLPGAAFNRHSCTMKYKVQPQNRWTAKWAPAQRAWAAGQNVTKMIGFESWWRQPRLTVERDLKTLGDQPLADVLNRLGTAAKRFGNPRVGPSRTVRTALSTTCARRTFCDEPLNLPTTCLSVSRSSSVRRTMYFLSMASPSLVDAMIGLARCFTSS